MHRNFHQPHPEDMTRGHGKPRSWALCAKLWHEGQQVREIHRPGSIHIRLAPFRAVGTQDIQPGVGSDDAVPVVVKHVARCLGMHLTRQHGQDEGEHLFMP